MDERGDDEALAAALRALPGLDRAVVVAEVDSTNARLAAAATAGAAPTAAMVAARQTAGRGRRGRAWQDLPSGNVAVSVAVPWPPARTGLLPLAAALALRDVVVGLGVVPSLKWPNDVRVTIDGRRRKVAGILVEALPEAPHPQAVVGVGVNLDWRGAAVEELPDATSLADAVGADVPRDLLVVALVRGILDQCARVAHDPDGLLRTYRGVCDTLGLRVRADLGSHVLVGMARDVTDDGALVVLVDGNEHVIAAADLQHLREA